MKKLVVILTFILMLAGVIAIGVISFKRLACEGQPINNNVAPTQDQQIWGDRSISQSFVAPRNDLNQVQVLLQTYQRQNTQVVTLSLFETNDDPQNLQPGTEIFHTSFNAATITDQAWHTFTFEPIANSAGKTYLLRFNSPGSIDGNAITVGGIERNLYTSGSAFLGPVPVGADITFRACFQMTASEKLQVLAEQLTRHRPSLWGTIIFYIIALITYGLILAGFYWQLTKSTLC